LNRQYLLKVIIIISVQTIICISKQFSQLKLVSNIGLNFTRTVISFSLLDKFELLTTFFITGLTFRTPLQLKCLYIWSIGHWICFWFDLPNISQSLNFQFFSTESTDLHYDLTKCIATLTKLDIVVCCAIQFANDTASLCRLQRIPREHYLDGKLRIRCNKKYLSYYFKLPSLLLCRNLGT